MNELCLCCDTYGPVRTARCGGLSAPLCLDCANAGARLFAVPRVGHGHRGVEGSTHAARILCPLHPCATTQGAS